MRSIALSGVRILVGGVLVTLSATGPVDAKGPAPGATTDPNRIAYFQTLEAQKALHRRMREKAKPEPASTWGLPRLRLADHLQTAAVFMLMATDPRLLTHAKPAFGLAMADRSAALGGPPPPATPFRVAASTGSASDNLEVSGEARWTLVTADGQHRPVHVTFEAKGPTDPYPGTLTFHDMLDEVRFQGRVDTVDVIQADALGVPAVIRFSGVGQEDPTERFQATVDASAGTKGPVQFRLSFQGPRRVAGLPPVPLMNGFLTINNHPYPVANPDTEDSY